VNELTDTELALAIASGEGAAAAEALLYRRFAARVELYGVRHLRSRAAAKDLVQEVLLRVVQALRARRLDQPERLGSYVLGTCRNAARDALRVELKQERVARAAAVGAEGSVAPSEEPALEEQVVLRLFGCMGHLPQREAAVVRMSFWEDRLAEDIGARLGVSAGNVRVIRHRALVKLVGCMNPESAA
jgi:RNA polymerase sigma-70 factor (ECF subfamily)